MAFLWESYIYFTTNKSIKVSINSYSVKNNALSLQNLSVFSFMALLTICFLSNTSNAQDTLELRMEFWNQRVGSQVKVGITTGGLSKNMREKVGDFEDYYNAGHFNFLLIFSDSITFTEAGPHTIGPYTFERNGHTFYTDSINVNVLNQLPWAEGVWVRVEELGIEKTLIIEQLVKPSPSIIDTLIEGTLMTIEGGLSDLHPIVNLENDSIDGHWFLGPLLFKMSRVRVNEEAPDPAFMYFYGNYAIYPKENFSGTITLTKEDFANWPDYVSFQPIEIDLRYISSEEYLKEWSKKLQNKQKKNAPK